MSATAEFFEAMYQRDSDPWNFASSAYEQLRYATVIEHLAQRQFSFGFEPGCSVGALTALLAPQCSHFLAIDVSSTAVTEAQRRCREFSHVDVRVDAIPMGIPQHPIDLVVFCEIGYYFTEAQLDFNIDQLAARLEQNGLLVSTNWLGHSVDHELHGSVVHQHLSGHQHLHLVHEHQAGTDGHEFVFGLWVRR
jgi:hypothetical protein